MDTIEHLLQRGQEAQAGGVAQALLSASEAERIIGQLAPLTLEEVGGPKWHTQHEWIERLNLQAHYNAQTHSDEFVMELLVSLDKMQVLVHDLLLIECWKEFVYPLLASHLAEHVDSVTTYVLLYHEVTVADLLQVALYHSHAAKSLSEDYALELADWCYRKLTRLNAEGHKLAEPRDRTAEELLSMSRLDEQEEKRREIEFSITMCSLAILRYITDSLAGMPMGALSRVVSTNDTLMALIPLLDKPPWVRTRIMNPNPQQQQSTNNGTNSRSGVMNLNRGGGGRPVLEKWVGNRWVVVPPADRLKITQTDGQVWLAVTNLLVEPRCRAKYGMDEFRRERILGLKRHLNELMFDQLPVLRDLQRVLDELALGVLPDQSVAGKSAALILEAVPVIRDSIMRGRTWRVVAEKAKQEHFGREAARMARERMEAMIKHLDFLCELEPEPAAAAAAAAAEGADAPAASPPPPVKVSTWRKVHDSGVFEPWYDFAMEVDESRAPDPVEVAPNNAGATGSSSSGTGGAVAAVHGLRYRLRPLDVDSTRPLPTKGKAVVRWGDQLLAEALLQLPELPTRDSAEGAAVLWVTVGLLAVDGLVLQVKLKKAPKPRERDRVAGVWYAYHPVAGALTVLRDHRQNQQQQQQGAAAVTATTAASSSATGNGSHLAVKVGGLVPSVPPQSSTAAAAEGGNGGSGCVKDASSTSTSRRPLVQVISEPPPPPAGARPPSSPPVAAASSRPDNSAGGGGATHADAVQLAAAAAGDVTLEPSTAVPPNVLPGEREKRSVVVQPRTSTSVNGTSTAEAAGEGAGTVAGSAGGGPSRAAAAGAGAQMLVEVKNGGKAAAAVVGADVPAPPLAAAPGVAEVVEKLAEEAGPGLDDPE